MTGPAHPGTHSMMTQEVFSAMAEVDLPRASGELSSKKVYIMLLQLLCGSASLRVNVKSNRLLDCWYK